MLLVLDWVVVVLVDDAFAKAAPSEDAQAAPSEDALLLLVLAVEQWLVGLLGLEHDSGAWQFETMHS